MEREWYVLTCGNGYCQVQRRPCVVILRRIRNYYKAGLDRTCLGEVLPSSQAASPHDFDRKTAEAPLDCSGFSGRPVFLLVATGFVGRPHAPQLYVSTVACNPDFRAGKPRPSAGD